MITKASATNTTFRVGSKATPIVAARTRRAPVGTRFRFTLSEPAAMNIGIAAAASGRLSGKKCLKPTRKLAKRKRCTRYVTAGVLTRTAKAGANTVAFSGRIGIRKLATGRYRATFVALADGLDSRPRTLGFLVVR